MTEPVATKRLSKTRRLRNEVHLCGDTDCPTDPDFEHRFYYGCVPKDFNGNTGRSKTHKQTKGPDCRYHWNGGCPR